MRKIDRCYDYSELNDGLLTEFAEGSKSLEELLKYSYINNIVTRACCKGHFQNDNNKMIFASGIAYISFIIQNNQFDMANYLIDKISSNELLKDKLQINVAIDEDGNKNNKLLSFYYEYDKENEEKREYFFSTLSTFLKKYINSEVYEEGKYNNFLQIFDKLYSENEVSSIGIKNDGIQFYGTRKGYILLNEDGSLDEISEEEANYYGNELNKTILVSDVSYVKFNLKENELEDFINQNISDVITDKM